MNINAKDVKNIIHLESEKMMKIFIKSQLNALEKKILIASKSGFDYVWYKLPYHYKFDNNDVCQKIIQSLEKKNFCVRLFEKNIFQIIW